MTLSAWVFACRRRVVLDETQNSIWPKVGSFVVRFRVDERGGDERDLAIPPVLPLLVM
jgi:hypothetical protein